MNTSFDIKPQNQINILLSEKTKLMKRNHELEKENKEFKETMKKLEAKIKFKDDEYQAAILKLSDENFSLKYEINNAKNNSESKNTSDTDEVEIVEVIPSRIQHNKTLPIANQNRTIENFNRTENISNINFNENTNNHSADLNINAPPQFTTMQINHNNTIQNPGILSSNQSTPAPVSTRAQVVIDPLNFHSRRFSETNLRNTSSSNYAEGSGEESMFLQTNQDASKSSKRGRKKQYKCDADGCTFKTTFKIALWKHSLHHKTENFKCVHCDYVTKIKKRLENHVASKHSELSPGRH